MRRSSLAVALCLTITGLATRAGAQAQSKAAQAEDLFDQGRAQMQAGDFPQACKLFERSLELDKAPVTQLNLAKCYEKIDRVASAWALYVEVDDTVDDPDLKKIAQEGAAAMKPLLPRLQVDVADAAVTVDVDGVAWTPGVAAAIDPGTHSVTASAPGKKPWKSEITTEKSKTSTVAVPALEDAPADPGPGTGGGLPGGTPGATDRPRVPNKTYRTIGLVTAGVGVVALGVGTWAGIDAGSKRDDAVAAGCNDDLSGCPDADALDIANAAYDRAGLSTTFFIAGGVLAVGGAALYFFAPSSPAPEAAGDTAWQVTPVVGPTMTGAALTGTF
jgi:tetratricopeptide (TPR) repeat protein